MFGLESTTLGITLLVFGLISCLLTYLMVRLVPKLRFFPRISPIKKAAAVDLPAHQDAVFLIEPGGWISHLNHEARNQFEIWEPVPNLEILARRARPSEIFWGLCTSEGQARFSMDGRPVEATSYYIPNGNGTGNQHGSPILLSIRPQEAITLSLDKSENLNRTIEILTRLNISMTADLALEPTLQAILKSVEELIPTDISEIAIWDPDCESLVPYRLDGTQGLDRRIQRINEQYQLGEGPTGQVADRLEPLLIADLDTLPGTRFVLDRKRFPFQSYLGVPLQIGGKLIGALGLMTQSANAYTSNDTHTLTLLTGQVSIAVHNALIYQDEQRRSEELANLTNLARAVSAVQDSDELFGHLVRGIIPILDIEMAGFLIYDEIRSELSAVNPFLGVPPHYVAVYKVPIPIDSPAERVWLSGEAVITQNAIEDPRMVDLGLDHHSRAAGIHNTALIPLAATGRVLGYLQVANKQDGTPFSPDDLRLLEIIALQAAAIIDNAHLIQESVGRALRADSLRRIASLTGSTATLDEIFKYSLVELARLIQADLAGIFILDEGLGELQVHPESLFGIRPEQLPQIFRLPINGTDFRRTVTASKVSFLTDDAALDDRVLPVFAALVEPLEVRAVIDVPIILQDRGLGEILLCSRRPHAFSQGDVQLAATVAGQIAISLERSQLALHSNPNLRQKVQSLTVLTRITRELSRVLDLPKMLRVVLDETIRNTRADSGAVLLFAEDSSPVDPKIAFQLGTPHREQLNPLELAAVKSNNSLAVVDYQRPPTEPNYDFDSDQWHPLVADTRSALVIPIAFEGQVSGLIHLFAGDPGQFDEPAEAFCHALASQAGMVIQSTRNRMKQTQLVEDLNRKVNTFNQIFDSQTGESYQLPLNKSLSGIAEGIRTSTSFENITIHCYDPSDLCLHPITNNRPPLDGRIVNQAEQEGIQPNPVPWSDIKPLMRPDFSQGRSYFIPHDLRPDLSIRTKAIFSAQDAEPTRPVQNEVRHPQDIWMVPLMDTQGEPLGLIQLSRPMDHRRPDKTSHEILELYASQAAVIIEGHHRYTALDSQVQQLNQRLEQNHDTSNQVPRLTHKVEEQAAEIQTLSDTHKRINAGLGIMEIVNRQPDRETVLAALGTELMALMRASMAMVAETGPGGPQLLHILGDVPEGSHPQALLGQHNPLSECLQTGTQIHEPDLKAADDWLSSPLLTSMKAAGFVCLPVMSGPHVDSAVIVISEKPLAPFSENDQRLFDLLAVQTGTAINNINILLETSHRFLEVNLLLDFSRQLGSLDPTSILTTLVDSSMQVAASSQAGFVALLDRRTRLLIPRVARGYRDVDALMKINFQAKTLPAEVCAKMQAARIDDLDFAHAYPLDADDLLHYRQATAGILPVSCNLIPIQSGSDPLGVIVLDNFQEAGAFSAEDQDLVTSLAQQTALSLENARLYQAAENRANQLQALSTAVTSITPYLELDDLVDSLLGKLWQVVPYETAILWQRDGTSLTIRAARGFEDNEEVKKTTTLESNPLFREMVDTNLPVAIDDIRTDSRFPAHETENISWLGIPLLTKGEMIGAIALEKSEPGFYTLENIQAATMFASQAGIAIENATLYQQSVLETLELDQRSQRLTLLNRFSNQIRSVLNPLELLEITLRELTVAVPASVVSGILWENGEPLLQAETPICLPGVEEPTSLPGKLPMAPLFKRVQQSLEIFSTGDVNSEEELGLLTDFFSRRETRALLVLPLATGEDLHGLVLVHNDNPYHYTADEIELARILTNQAAVAILNAFSFEATTRLTEQLEARVAERTAQLEHEYLREQSLLRIMRELSTSLDLDQVLNQTLGIINETIGAQHSTILLIHHGEGAFYYRASVGYDHQLPPGGQLSSLKLDQGLAGWVVQHRESAVIGNVQTDDRWIQVGGLSAGYASVIIVPLMVGEEILGVVTLGHTEIDAFTTDDQEMAQAAAMQMAVAINNAELFNLIRDQAEGLGTMLRSQQVEASRSMAILEAVADGVLVTDDLSLITLFNLSAQNILDLPREDVIGKSLEDFTGLFGHAAHTWMDTIRSWASDPSAYQVGETYAERISLDKERVVDIHLAPVFMGSEFLGTVTIFRDITHQVEVDRLKSEFVATVSHELRTPMTSIKGYVDILLMGAAGQLTQQQNSFLDIVKTNTERLNILVNDLLDVSRIEAGKMEMSIHPQDIRILIEDVVRDLVLRSEKEDRPMGVHLDLPADLPRVPCDEERVRQILDNLVSNAYQYTPAEGRIDIQVNAVDDHVQVDVQDNGIGIHPDDHEKIFERFYRGENPLVLASSGNGLGLSIVRQLVDMHHGRLWVESNGITGEGSTFSFTLPLEPPEKPD